MSFGMCMVVIGRSLKSPGILKLLLLFTQKVRKSAVLFTFYLSNYFGS